MRISKKERGIRMNILLNKWGGYYSAQERRQGTNLILVSNRQKGVTPRG